MGITNGQGAGLSLVIISGGSSGSGVITNTHTTTPITGSAATGITVEVMNVASASTFNLPASPVANEIVIVQDGSMNAATNNITIQGNGNNINVPNLGVETSTIINWNGGDMWFNWNGSAWGVTA